MEIKSDSFYVNKTRKYLLPILVDYGPEFIQNLDKVFKLGVGIGDTVIPEELNLNHHIFILVNINKFRENDGKNKEFHEGKNGFRDFIYWIRKQDYFQFDYAYDDIISGHQHMVVLKLPENHKLTYEHFVNNQFSKMYSKENIRKYFKSNDIRFSILCRDSRELIKFVDNINKEYHCSYTYKEWNSEIEFPLNDSEEKFNYKLIIIKDDNRKEQPERVEKRTRKHTIRPSKTVT